MEILDSTKLDYDLFRLTQMNIHGSQELPVVVTVADCGDLGEIRTFIIRESGRIRHVLTEGNAISAWIPLSRIPSITSWDCVESIELSQVSFSAFH